MTRQPETKGSRLNIAKKLLLQQLSLKGQQVVKLMDEIQVKYDELKMNITTEEYHLITVALLDKRHLVYTHRGALQ